jgi:hypothetical protein
MIEVEVKYSHTVLGSRKIVIITDNSVSDTERTFKDVLYCRIFRYALPENLITCFISE